VRRPGCRSEHRTGRAATVLLALAVTASLTVAAPAAHADPVPGAPGPASALPGEGHGPRDRDNRGAPAAPSARQRALAARLGPVRWNALGTPQALASATPLATGLPADPEAAARQYLTGNADLFGIAPESVAGMEVLLRQPIGTGTAVLLRQRFGDLPAGRDGLVTILVAGGSVVRVTSSLARDTRAPEPATLDAAQAAAAAVRDAGLTPDQASVTDTRLVAVPTPADGPRAAYAVTLSGHDAADPTAYTTYVDARSGAVLVRDDLVDFDSDNPVWSVFQATPPATIRPGTDPRVLWCLTPTRGCVRTVRDAASGQAWDVDLTTGAPTDTSAGNSAQNVVRWGAGTPDVPATPRPDRTYSYPFTDQWQRSGCDPAAFTSAQRVDGDAAVANLFAMHNRMHDWSYRLGFTEATWNLQAVNLVDAGLGNDAEQGRAQSNALGGSRNNANQATPRDGLKPQTNMFLWQPVAGGAYPPCVDGDFDMTVIGHEYTHAISNRMIAGPDAGISGYQGGSMGEAWSDLVAIEYLAEYGLRAPGATPFVVGAYVTGDNTIGIRNYDGSRSPLNFSDLGYDLVGPEVHADGEIWVATNLRLRAAFVRRYGQGTPWLQRRCADGQAPVTACPGNRRWMQLVFDSFVLQAAGTVGMLDMRDNLLAADQVRFGGANQDLIWNAFAESGMGRDAAGAATDTDPTPSFVSPRAATATVTLHPVGDAAGAVVRLYAGDYEARSVPVADTDPATPIPDTFQVVAGLPLDYVAAGPGLGLHRFQARFRPGASRLPLDLPRNLAATASGATVSGDGINLDRLVDDSEATDWASLDGVAGKQVTIDLAGSAPRLVRTIDVSALLRPAITNDPDTGVQNRFSALRSFTVLACNAAVADCTRDASYRRVYRSAPDAFPGGPFRPTASQLNLRTFHLPPTLATHLRLVVDSSQCTGNPHYAGEQDNDPSAGTDCATASPFAQQVRVAEFEAFSR
jgi:extracellular elastinolytic metalloproteinase